MSFMLRVPKSLFVGCLLAASPAWLLAQSDYAPEAAEYPVVGIFAGDQTRPDLGLNSAGGFIVWQDNITDGSGWGISARSLNSSFSGSLGTFRVNLQGADDQENPRVSLLNGGGAAFVWQGGKPSYQHIYARLLTAAGTWVSGEVMVNTFTNDYQASPAAATLTNGNVMVVWSSRNQEGANSMQGVYGQLLTSSGAKSGSEFLINQTTAFNQRTPAVAALKDGRFVVAWVSEQQRFENSVDIYARLFNAGGSPAGGEFLVSSSTNVCANPSVVAAAEGGFVVAWSEKDLNSPFANSWDVMGRVFTSTGLGGVVRRINTTTYGDQYAPKLSAIGSDYLVVWVSLGQDGSGDGIYGQFLHADGSLSGSERLINTTTASEQRYPVVGSNGDNRFLVAWSGFGPGVNGFDLYAQRFALSSQPLPTPAAPMVTALDSSKLLVAWATMDGFSVTNYEVYADGAVSASVVVTSNYWRATGLSPSTAHTYRMAYVLTDGRRSALSAAGSGTTWGTDDNFDGLPDDFETLYFGANSANWPAANADSDGDGASNRDEFLAGTNPNSAASVLRITLTSTPQGLFLSWNTKAGRIYKVQTATTIGAWSDLGLPRFANGTTDSIYVGSSQSGYYRVVCVR